MQIEHIFNAVKTKVDNNKSIDSQEFTKGYWRNNKENYIYDAEYPNDFSRLYYHALVPSKNSAIISKYDDEKIENLTQKLGDDLLLIRGDFWGIQDFIFDGLTATKVSKILRSRSAMVQLITYAVVAKIKKEFIDSDTLLFGAGKFMILAKNENNQRVKTIQEELDSYFLKNFFGQNGFILSSTTTTKEKLSNQSSMENDLDNLSKDNDTKKLNKFDLLNVKDDDIVIDPFDGGEITDATSCKFCNKRIETHRVDNDTKACHVCFYQIELGKRLTKKRYISIYESDNIETKENIEIIKLGDNYYYASFDDNADKLYGEIFDISSDDYFDYPKWSLNSYVAKEDNGEIKDFSVLAQNSSGLMALKADIDKLGDTFRELYKEDFRKFNRLSREVEFFFSDYITSLLEKKNIYTVFAGGDDLFIIGEYREIVKIAKEIRDEFYKFSLKKTTISMGLVMFKPTTPINFVSKLADEAEKRAKIKRDSIDIFGVSMKFDEFLEIENNFDDVVKYLEENKIDTTTFYYKLIEFCDMKRDINEDMKNAMWQSKLNYIFQRNVYYKLNEDKREESLKIQHKIHQLIRIYDEKFKPSLFLKIYQNRDKTKEKRDD